MAIDPPGDPAPRSGLRERKKQATREALTWAALRLAHERGLENVRVEDIAAEAGVSPRTFNNYFSSKYEAIVSRQGDRVRQSAAELRARPADEPLWEAVVHAALAPYGVSESVPGPEWIAGVRMLLGEPALQSELLRVSAAAGAEFTAAVAERTGTDARHDPYPNLLSAAVLAALQTAQELWLRADPPVQLLPLMRDALRLLADGLPDPSTG
ncbi:TetR/AcrR family transcriptional regulator [Streptacidiphilus griseoplanus]|uniref:TetR/AcrR family transcriptional regulator n=1 Tax=Peterkaempfera griseoplana TaxID=66896 RepID=UPI0006E4324C|nr:TetR/AcrR family transcriptional regulator [Peterkaempfera griseoplana]